MLYGFSEFLFIAHAARAKSEPDALAVSHDFSLLDISNPAVVGAALGMADVMAELLGFSADIALHEITLSFDCRFGFVVKCLCFEH
jgi:hypothetical protein